MFLEHAFALRLKNDFSYVYVDNKYCNNGLVEDVLAVAKQGKLVLDPNTKALVEFYDFFELTTLGTKQEADARSQDRKR